MNKEALEELRQKFADYPNILKFIELRVAEGNSQDLRNMREVSEAELSKAASFGGRFKSFKAIDEFLGPIMKKLEGTLKSNLN